MLPRELGKPRGGGVARRSDGVAVPLEPHRGCLTEAAVVRNKENARGVKPVHDGRGAVAGFRRHALPSSDGRPAIGTAEHDEMPFTRVVPQRSNGLTTRWVGQDPPFHRFRAKSQQLLVWPREPDGEEVILNMMDFISNLRTREEGQALVEYALILSLIAVVCIGALTLLGGNVNNILNQIAAAL
jgi:pilus assembly protein Flp/PilA